MSRFFTKGETLMVKGLYGKPGITCADIAQAIGRSMSGVCKKAKELGLVKKHDPRLKRRVIAAIREHHPKGWTDSKIANIVSVSRWWISERRRELGLPSNALSQWRINQIRRKTRQQLKRAGLTSMSQLRLKVWRDRARECGWPEDLRKREVDILNLLWDRGPMTRREIAAAVGFNMERVEEYGQRCMLHDGGPSKAFPISHGSYLANLVARGLLISMKRAVRTGRQGGNVNLYTLPLDIRRGEIKRRLAG